MKLRATLVLCVALLPGCKKKKKEEATDTTKVEMRTGSDTATGSATGSAATGSAASAGKCAEGAYKDPDGFYCVVVPEGYKPTDTLAKNDEDHIVDSFASEDNQFFQVTVWKKGMTWDNEKATLSQHIEGNTPSEATEGEGGNSFTAKIHLEKSKQTGTGYAIKAGDKIIDCWAMTNDATPLKPADPCKTLRAL